MKINDLLIEAAKKGNLNTVKFALENGADISHRDIRGRTALYWAKILNHSEIVSYLVNRGAQYTVSEFEREEEACEKSQKTNNKGNNNSAQVTKEENQEND